MGPDINIWQMVIGVEHEIAVHRATRLGTLGAPSRRGNRVLGWLKRLASPSPAATPPSATCLPARGAGA